MRRPEMAVVLATAVSKITRAMTLVLRPRARVRALSYLMETLDPVYTNETRYGPVHFYCPATWPYSRSDMLKEPKTYEWIETFKTSDVFWDVGANVGVYSLYAAKRGHRVYAFEPAAVNYFVLAKNVELNELDDQITFLNVALNDKTILSSLYMSHTRIGGAQHSFGEPQNAETKLKPYARPNMFRQSAIGYSIDGFIETFEAEFPNHIKIDVDGNEDKIISGASNTVTDPRLKSLLVEIRPDRRVDVIGERLAAAGFGLKDVSGMNHVFVRP